MIEFKNSRLSIRHQCKLLGLARATAYHKSQEKVPSKEEIRIKNAMDEIHYREPSFGVRRIQTELWDYAHVVGRRRIRRYMQEMDMVAFYPGPNLSKRAKMSKTYPYLLRHLFINRPNQVWSIDISYIGTPTGFVYLTAIIDWYSRFIVGCTISNTLQADTVTRVVKDAVRAYGTPEIINSDQGAQFTSNEYIDLIKSLKATKISMDGRGRATDNIAIERFFRSLKWERIYPMYPETVAEVKQMIQEYISHYNYHRRHQRYNYQIPAAIYFETLPNAA